MTSLMTSTETHPVYVVVGTYGDKIQHWAASPLKAPATGAFLFARLPNRATGVREEARASCCP